MNEALPSVHADCTSRCSAKCPLVAGGEIVDTREVVETAESVDIPQTIDIRDHIGV